MITVLTIKQQKPCELAGKFLALFSPYEIKVRHIRDKQLGLNMLHVKYIQKSGAVAVRFKKIKRAVHADFTETVCACHVALPRSLGFKRFESEEFSCRLCVNAAEKFVRRLDHNSDELRISLYDPSGIFSYAAEQLVKYTSALKVATSARRFYEAENERLMCEYGAALLIRDRLSEILPCDVLIAPQTITEPIFSASTTHIFTGSRPKASVSGIVHDNFEATLPDCFKDIKPAELSDTYFLSALYSLEKMSWLINNS